MGAALKTCDKNGYHDICFILDESGSIGWSDWNKAIDFIQKMVDAVEIS
jgi:hypothetical protein